MDFDQAEHIPPTPAATDAFVFLMKITIFHRLQFATLYDILWVIDIGLAEWASLLTSGFYVVLARRFGHGLGLFIFDRHKITA